jgi:hypothetical protein
MNALKIVIEEIPYVFCPKRSKRETKRKADAQAMNGDTTRKGRKSMRATLSFIQRPTNGTMQGRGWSKMAIKRGVDLADEAEKNTTARRVKRAEKPRRQSFTHHKKELNAAPKTTPRMMKKSHKIQPKKERATVLLSTNMGSPRTTLLMTQSKKKFTAKRDTPSKSPLVNPSSDGKRKQADAPAIIEMTAMPNSAFLKDGRKNRDE